MTLAVVSIMAWVVSGGLAGAAQPVAAQDVPAVRAVFIYSEDCPHCMEVYEETIEPLSEQYGDRLQVKLVRIIDPETGEIDQDMYEVMLAVEEAFDVAPDRRDIPMLVLGSDVLVGEDEIKTNLECRLEGCLAEGGVQWPDIPGLAEAPVLGQAEQPFEFDPLPAQDVGSCSVEEAVCEVPSPIYIAYFHKIGCQECDRVELDLEYVAQKAGAQVIVEEFEQNEYAAQFAWMCERASVPFERRMVTPAVFIGDDYLIEEQITVDALMAIIETYDESGASRFWEGFDESQGMDVVSSLMDRIGVLAVLGAGLLDGLNPCAFATLVFLISYLTAMKRKGTEVLLVGVAFTLGVFVTYLSIGLGAWRLLSAVPDLARWGRWAIGATALLCLFLAVFSFLDFLRARKGDVKEMRLTMPDRLRKRANAAIRQVSTARAFVLLSFPLGVVVSVLELACTGQVYLPVIMAALSMPEHRISAVLLLVLYNLMFVLPLIVVFCLVYSGKTAFQLGQALKRHAATVKLGTAVLFLILAGWLALTAASSAGLLQAAG